MHRRSGRLWHLLTAVITLFALIFQFVLVARGQQVLVEVEPPAMGTRMIRFFSYFTILSNILVLFSTATLALRTDRDSRWWRVIRLNALVGITVTAIVAYFFLRPLMNLTGTAWVADLLVHVVAPLMAIAGWIAFGPGGRIRRADVPLSLIYPVGWLAYTLIRGAVVHWYPYPFLDVDTIGVGRTLLNCLGVAVLLVGLSVIALFVDRRLPGRDRPAAATAPG